MRYVRFLLSLRQVEDLLAERGIEIRHKTVRLWWNRFGPTFGGLGRVESACRVKSVGQGTGAFSGDKFVLDCRRRQPPPVIQPPL